MTNDAIERGYEKLAEAIIVQAGIDYLKTKKALDNLKPGQSENILLKRLAEIRGFFKSQWYRDLTDVDSRWLITKLDDTYEDMKSHNQLNLIDKLTTGGV